MPKAETKPDLFFAAHVDDEKKYRGYATGSKEYIEECVGRWKKRSSEGAKEEKFTAETQPDFTRYSVLSDAFENAVNFCMSHHHQFMIMDAVGDTFGSYYFQKNILGLFEQNSECIENEENVKIFKITPQQFDKFEKAHQHLKHMEEGLARLPQALFVGLIASFDALLVDIMTKMVSVEPKRYFSKDLSITLNEIFDYSSMEEVVAKIVSDEIYKFSRESHEIQVGIIEKNFHIKIKDHWKRWSAFIEVFERRNLIAHGEKYFNSKYIETCNRNGASFKGENLGTIIQLSQNYCHNAIDVISEFAILLIFSLWRKHLPEQEAEAFTNLNEAGFKLISTGHCEIAEKILDYGVSLKNTRVSESTRRMMIVNLASSTLRKNDAGRACKILDAEDWTAASIEFRICVSAVKGEISEVCSLMPLAKSSGVTISCLRTWPVFRYCQENEEFRKSVKENYGEDLLELDHDSGDESQTQDKIEEKFESIQSDAIH
jgi:hypothetical protein